MAENKASVKRPVFKAPTFVAPIINPAISSAATSNGDPIQKTKAVDSNIISSTKVKFSEPKVKPLLGLAPNVTKPKTVATDKRVDVKKIVTEKKRQVVQKPDKKPTVSLTNEQYEAIFSAVLERSKNFESEFVKSSLEVDEIIDLSTNDSLPDCNTADTDEKNTSLTESVNQTKMGESIDKVLNTSTSLDDSLRMNVTNESEPLEESSEDIVSTSETDLPKDPTELTVIKQKKMKSKISRDEKLKKLLSTVKPWGSHAIRPRSLDSSFESVAGQSRENSETIDSEDVENALNVTKQSSKVPDEADIPTNVETTSEELITLNEKIENQQKKLPNEVTADSVLANRGSIKSLGVAKIKRKLPSEKTVASKQDTSKSTGHIGSAIKKVSNIPLPKPSKMRKVVKPSIQVMPKVKPTFSRSTGNVVATSQSVSVDNLENSRQISSNDTLGERSSAAEISLKYYRRSWPEVKKRIYRPLPPKFRNRKEFLAWLMNERDVGVWIQCCNSECNMWRYVHGIKEPVGIPDQWYCEMNPDPNNNECKKGVDEEIPDFDPEDDFDILYNDFTAGSIVWAKMDGFPWWPGMVDDDPDTESFYWLDHEASKIPSYYNVVFFDDKVTRAWIACNDLKKYDGKIITTKAAGKCYTPRLSRAMADANKALDMTYKERLQTYSFLVRYTGPIRRPRETKDERENEADCDEDITDGLPLRRDQQHKRPIKRHRVSGCQNTDSSLESEMSEAASKIPRRNQDSSAAETNCEHRMDCNNQITQHDEVSDATNVSKTTDCDIIEGDMEPVDKNCKINETIDMFEAVNELSVDYNNNKTDNDLVVEVSKPANNTNDERRVEIEDSLTIDNDLDVVGTSQPNDNSNDETRFGTEVVTDCDLDVVGVSQPVDVTNDETRFGTDEVVTDCDLDIVGVSQPLDVTNDETRLGTEETVSDCELDVVGVSQPLDVTNDETRLGTEETVSDCELDVVGVSQPLDVTNDETRLGTEETVSDCELDVVGVSQSLDVTNDETRLGTEETVSDCELDVVGVSQPLDITNDETRLGTEETVTDCDLDVVGVSQPVDVTNDETRLGTEETVTDLDVVVASPFAEITSDEMREIEYISQSLLGGDGNLNLEENLDGSASKVEPEANRNADSDNFESSDHDNSLPFELSEE